MDYVYILTNDSLKGFIKIGKAKDPENRAKQLSKSTAIPMPFSVYAKMAVPTKDVYKVEAFLHNTLKMWVTKQKEYFKIAPETALLQFQYLADLNGYNIIITGEEQSAPVKTQNTTFKSLGIKSGTKLYYIPDSDTFCITLDDKNNVDFNGEKTTLSGIGKKLLGYNVNGYTIFSTEPDGEPLVSYKGK